MGPSGAVPTGGATSGAHRGWAGRVSESGRRRVPPAVECPLITTNDSTTSLRWLKPVRTSDGGALHGFSLTIPGHGLPSKP